MYLYKLVMFILLSILLIVSFGCKDKPADSETKLEKEIESEGDGEESGHQLAIDETYDTVRKGLRLILKYDSASSKFVGTVENVTKETIKSVRVEVHLSNGTELGPTNPIDLPAGKKGNVKISAESQSFTWYKAHPEAGTGEHGHEHEHGEHSHEHGDHSHENRKGEHKHE